MEKRVLEMAKKRRLGCPGCTHYGRLKGRRGGREREKQKTEARADSPVIDIFGVRVTPAGAMAPPKRARGSAASGGQGRGAIATGAIRRGELRLQSI